MPHLRFLRPIAVLVCLALTATSWATPEQVDELVRNTLQMDRHPQAGGKLFQKVCASCHGVDAAGVPDRGVPSLAGQRRAYLIKQMADFQEAERDNAAMHVVATREDVGNPQAWADIAAYLNGLPPAQFTEKGDGEDLELGEAIFQEQCASCHEEDARGDDDGFVPSLRNQHYSYLLQQMRDLSTWHRRNVDADLVRYMDSLEPDEIRGVVDYLARMQGKVRDRTRLDDDGTAGD